MLATSIKVSQHIKANRTNGGKKSERYWDGGEQFEILKMQSKIASIPEKCYHFCGAVLKDFFRNYMENNYLYSKNAHDKVRIK